ncbi:protein of unknown function [Cupriavidus taiwanensis]|nr:protein of unknown function [Cupriavidus taiwanensis]
MTFPLGQPTFRLNNNFLELLVPFFKRTPETSRHVRIGHPLPGIANTERPRPQAGIYCPATYTEEKPWRLP